MRDPTVQLLDDVRLLLTDNDCDDAREATWRPPIDAELHDGLLRLRYCDGSYLDLAVVRRFDADGDGPDDAEINAMRRRLAERLPYPAPLVEEPDEGVDICPPMTAGWCFVGPARPGAGCDDNDCEGREA